MAIHEGNSDFKLSVVKSGTKGIRVRWDKENTGIRLNVYRPGDGANVYNKSFTGKTGDVTITLPFFGQYRIHISTNQGYTWDAMKFHLNLTSTVTSTHIYTATDVNKYKTEQLIVTAAFTALGISSIKRLAITSSLVALSINAGQIWQYDTNLKSVPAPRQGWKLRTQVSPTTGGIKYTYTTIDDKDQVQHTTSVTHKYLTYPN